MEYEDDLQPPQVLLTPQEVLQAGLKLVRFTEGRIGRAGATTNSTRFKRHYGCNQIVAAQLFEDLQITSIDEARLDDGKISITYFLQALNFLKVYETEDRREGLFDLSPKTMRDWQWYYVKKIQALKGEKIVFPEDFGSDIWILSVDCSDCPIEEIAHHTLSQDSELWSFKLNGPGLRYELGIDLFRSSLIWMNGPFKPRSLNDNTIFAEFGLKEKLAALGKKGLGDKIYNGHPDECSTFNSVDTSAVRTFKARVQMRHEQFNGMMKEFKVTSTKFRHKPDKIEKHTSCYEAVAVICQYRLEHGEPLFDLMAGF